MRAIRFEDLSLALRVLLAAPPWEREGLAQHLLEEADLADRYRRRIGRCMEAGGDGTLLATALGRPLSPPVSRLGRAEIRTLMLLLTAIEQHRDEAACRGGKGPAGLSS